MERNEPREITARAGEFQGACCDTHDRSRSASTGSSATTAASLPPPRILPRSSSAPAGSPSYARSTKRRPPGRRQSALSASATASERGPLPPPVWRRQDQKPKRLEGIRESQNAACPHSTQTSAKAECYLEHTQIRFARDGAQPASNETRQGLGVWRETALPTTSAILQGKADVRIVNVVNA